ncbi:hypothetical protein LCGC14_2587460 [marine sediment metagenome]|uniref:Uncharacterized protein n=1 Tax=marine sediment metagenome TaxID=412755 RepID=A0A0F9ACK9_9ZZZZ
MEKVVITRPFVGICYMQVCAEKDATDEEILNICNTNNPSGTFNGRGVVREVNDLDQDNMLPVVCKICPERLHFIVYC